MSVSYGGDSITFADGSVASSGHTGFRNRIINGDMRIDQRKAGSSVTTVAGDNYTPDRWLVYDGTGSKLAVQQVTDGPTGSGFVKSQKITSQAATTPGSTAYYLNCQRIEGFNVSDLGWGTANAATVTLSFWVKSSLTGSFSGAFGNTSFDRSYPFSYTINAANTWEQKTVTVAGDTTGTWATDNTAGLQVVFDLGSGSSRAGAANTWSANDYRKVTGSVNLIGTNGATWQLTGVQLEKGTTASTFEFRSYGKELMLCQRYYEKNYPLATVPADGTNPGFGGGYRFISAYSTTGSRYYENFRVPKRASPTMTFYKGDNANQTNGRWGYYNNGWASFTSFSSTANENGFGLDANVSSGFNLGFTYLTDGGYTASAEL